MTTDVQLNSSRGLGRTVQERHTAEPDPVTSDPRFRVTGWQVFNHKGLVVRAYQPFFGETDAYGTGDTDTAFVQTTYDPLGRPVRVDYPDGTFETTEYHPWTQVFRDRNDNAGHLTGEDERYGDHLAEWTDHLDTPTRKYVDALGREIAVAEDNGEIASQAPTFRTTTYEIRAGEFTGTTCDLSLENPLSVHHFVMIAGGVAASAPDADNVGVRVTHDPFGTGSLGTSSANNVLRLARGKADVGDWQGTVTVVECLGDEGASGFALIDVLEVACDAEGSAGPQTTNTTANTAWSDLSRVAVYGGPRGGGATTDEAAAPDWPSLSAAITPSSTNAIAVARHGGSQPLVAATFTLYVVQWGSEHTIQRVTLSGDAGDADLEDPSAWDTAPITEVDTAHTWLWMSGHTEADGENEAFAGLLLTLGDGETLGATADAVAVGAHYPVDKACVVTVHSHPSFAVDWRFKALGDGGATAHAHDVADAIEADSEEEYAQEGADNPKITVGHRFGVHTNAGPGTGDTYGGALFFARHTGSDALSAERLAATSTWAARVQSVDLLGVTHATKRLHVTRSVLDLKDQVVEVYDARGLEAPTWEFAYDLAGRRVRSNHTTALGERFALADAVGNPIWARDARGIEVTRTFDVLNRPLAELSDDGGGPKRRRMWSYVEYDNEDPDFATFQSKNLFGQVEEARDADGLRFFEYDWRGLVTKGSHRFWDTTDGDDKDWTDTGSEFWDTDPDWDPEVPDTTRGSITDWLTLPDLTDPTTVEVTTSYDAAGRPTEIVYPESFQQKNSYNAAGLLDKVEVQRTSGYEVVIEDCAYNARGQLQALTHGNGVVSTREYDEDLERLVRIFTHLPADAPDPRVDFQDLHYAYDPVGNPIVIRDDLSESEFVDNRVIPNTRTFRYDARYRLIQATGKKHNTVVRKGLLGAIPNPNPLDYVPYRLKYAYDEVGNFTRNQEYAWGPIFYKSGRIDLFNGDGHECLDADPGSGNFVYDENGNTLHTPRLEELRYTHDNQVRFVDLDGGGVVRYLRHSDQRVLRFVNKSGVKALGVYLGAFEYHHRIGSTAFSKVVLHVNGHGRHAQVEKLLDGSDSDSLPIFFHHGDHLGSGHVLSDADGELLSQEEYFPYGSASDRRDTRNRYRFIGVEQDEDTGLCMTGPRTYDPVSGRFLQGDPDCPRLKRPEGVDVHVASGRRRSAPAFIQDSCPYGYAVHSPLRAVDSSGLDALLIVFPDYEIEVAEATRVRYIGHAGVLIIDPATGTTKYREYGRYDPEEHGVVRESYQVPNVTIGPNGFPTPESLEKTLAKISRASGQHGRIDALYFRGDYSASLAYAEARHHENSDPARDPYSLLNNNCFTFAVDTAIAGGQVNVLGFDVPIPRTPITGVTGGLPVGTPSLQMGLRKWVPGERWVQYDPKGDPKLTTWADPETSDQAPAVAP